MNLFLLLLFDIDYLLLLMLVVFGCELLMNIMFAVILLGYISLWLVIIVIWMV